MKESAIKSVPMVFYDLIVYYGSSFFFLGILGLTFIGFEKIAELCSKLSALSMTFGVMMVVSFCYVYGQFASTFSSIVIKRPISRLVKLWGGSSRKDYFFDYFESSEDFVILEKTGKTLRKNYWTIIYFVMLYFPTIADDLLKRYARCKLARVNAFNFLFLSVLTFTSSLLEKLGWCRLVSTCYFSCFTWAMVFLVATLACSWEFYQRQCWFGDILVKIFAAVVKKLSMNGSSNLIIKGS